MSELVTSRAEDRPTTNDWYFEGPSQSQHGPVSAAELWDKLKAGAVTPDTRVWHEGLGPSWLPLKHTDFFAHAGPPPLYSKPPPPLEAARPAVRGPDQVVAWLLAFVPVIALVLFTVIDDQIGTGTALLLTHAAFGALLLYDRTAIRKFGPELLSIPAILASLLVTFVTIPFYLRRRALAFGQSLAPFYVSAAIQSVLVLLWVIARASR